MQSNNRLVVSHFLPEFVIQLRRNIVTGLRCSQSFAIITISLVQEKLLSKLKKIIARVPYFYNTKLLKSNSAQS